MKTNRILILTLVVLFAFPSISGAMRLTPDETEIQGCFESTFGRYSYQGDIDPQTVIQDWIVLEDETRPYGLGAIEVYYRNPDMPCEIPIAVFLVHKGVLASFAYLQNGEVHLYALDLESKCYRGDVLQGYARHSFKLRLGEALGMRSI